MRLETITLRNFGSYVDANVDLREIATGVITGQNGAGKSTAFVDGPLWALFGKCRLDTDAMVRLGTDDMAVIVMFELNGQRYRVIRKRSLKTKAGKSDLELQVMAVGTTDPEFDAGAAAWQPISGARLADTQQKIIELLSADYELMVSTSFLVQGQAARFSQATPSERKAILALILRLAQYAELKTAAMRAAGMVSAKADLHQATLNTLSGTAEVLETLQREQASIGERRTRLTEELGALDRERTTLMETQARDQAALDGLQAVPEQLEKARRRRDDLKTKEQGLDERRTRLEKIVANRSTIEDKVQEAEAKTAELEGLQAAERKLTTQIDELAIRIREAQQEAGKGTEIALRLSEARKSVAEAVRLYQDETAQLGRARETVQRQIDEAVRTYQQESAAIARQIEDLQRELGQAIDGYLRETETMRHAVDADIKAVALLGQVPCNAELQRQCQFTLQAVEAQQRLGSSRPELDTRLTDRHAIAQMLVPKVLEALRAALAAEALRLTDPQAIAEDAASARVAEQQALTQQMAERMTDETAIAMAITPMESAMVSELQQELAAWTQLGWEGRVAGYLQQETTAKAERTANRAQQQTVQVQIEEIKKFTVLEPELRAADRDFDQIKADMAAVVLDLAEVLKTIDDGTRQLEERQTLTAKLAQTALDLEQTDQRWGAQVAVEQGLIHQAGQLAEKIMQAEADLIQIEDLTKLIRTLQTDLRQYSLLAEAYAVIPVLVLESSIPLIEAEANRILAKISTSGLRVSLETQKTLKSRDGLAETLDITVRDVYGERPYETYSGGEKARVDLAIRIGLSKLLANRAGARLETLVVDEAFAAVDREGVEQLVECLPMLAQEFPLVLFVTHDEEFKSSVAQQIVVHKNGAGSTVEVLG